MPRLASKENSNLIKRLKEPHFFIHAFSYWALLFLKRVFQALKKKLFRHPDYPPYLKRIDLKNNSKMDYYNKGFLKRLSSPAQAEDDNIAWPGLKKPLCIELATQKVLCNNLPEWFQRFDDQEDMFSLHRWGWLLMLGVSNPRPEIKKLGIRVMHGWFSKMMHRKNHPAWESYSVSERIVNSLLFFYFLRHWPCDNSDEIYNIEQNLIDMADFLANHLEFNGDSTNNHILNNARALYMLGVIASCNAMADMGRQIFIKETPKMIASSGFLREGSSNYHLFLLRTYFEILWAAELVNDTKFLEIIKPVAESMLEAAWFFNVYDWNNKRWVAPLVGDVCPDFPPEWLENICRSGPALKLQNPFGCDVDLSGGWNNIWDKAGCKNTYPQTRIKNPASYKLFHDCGWYRLDHGDLTIFWHVYPNGPEPAYSHGHNDICSFIIYWKGCQVIIDPGRFSYALDSFGLYGKMAAAHNTFTVDGLDSYPIMRDIYPPGYIKGRPCVDWGEDKGLFWLRVSHAGFHRINKRLTASREFRITNNILEIRDCIEGEGSNRVRTFFHFADGVEVVDTDMQGSIGINLKTAAGAVAFKSPSLAGENAVKKIISGQTYPEPTGWCFPRYGKAVPIKTMIIEESVNFPYNAKYTMQFID